MTDKNTFLRVVDTCDTVVATIRKHITDFLKETEKETFTKEEMAGVLMPFFDAYEQHSKKIRKEYEQQKGEEDPPTGGQERFDG